MSLFLAFKVCNEKVPRLHSWAMDIPREKLNFPTAKIKKVEENKK